MKQAVLDQTTQTVKASQAGSQSRHPTRTGAGSRGQVAQLEQIGAAIEAQACARKPCTILPNNIQPNPLAPAPPISKGRKEVS